MIFTNNYWKAESLGHFPAQQTDWLASTAAILFTLPTLGLRSPLVSCLFSVCIGYGVGKRRHVPWQHKWSLENDFVEFLFPHLHGFSGSTSAHQASRPSAFIWGAIPWPYGFLFLDFKLVIFSSVVSNLLIPPSISLSSGMVFTISRSWLLIDWWVLIFWDRVSYSPQWPWTHLCSQG